MTTLGKDIDLTFFGSRTGEALSLGIGMKVIYWFLIGLALLLLGFLLRRRSKATELLSAKQISLLRRLQKEKELEQLQKEKEVEKPPKENELEQLQEEREEDEKKVEPPVKPPEKEEGISGCLHHFGYLTSRLENAPIPEECLICPRLADCMVRTVYIGKQKEERLAEHS